MSSPFSMAPRTQRSAALRKKSAKLSSGQEKQDPLAQHREDEPVEVQQVGAQHEGRHRAQALRVALGVPGDEGEEGDDEVHQAQEEQDPEPGPWRRSWYQMISSGRLPYHMSMYCAKPM